VRGRLRGIGILPMMHGLEAHATVGSSARIEPNPSYVPPETAARVTSHGPRTTTYRSAHVRNVGQLGPVVCPPRC